MKNFILFVVLSMACAGTVRAQKRSVAKSEFEKMKRILKGSMIEDDAVFLEGGMFKVMQDHNETFLLQLDIDRLTARHYIKAGKTPKAQPYGGWEDRESAGFGIGHYISAIVLMYKKTGNPVYKEKLDYAISEIGLTQNPSGFIGGFDEQIFIKEVFNKPNNFSVSPYELGGIWDAWYGIQKVIKGLVEAHIMTGNKQALEIVERFCVWATEQTNKLNYSQMQRMLTSEYGGMSETLLWLYGVTKKQEHLDLAYRFLRNDDLHYPLSEGNDILNGRHVNEHVPEVQNGAVYYIYTGDKRYKKSSEFFWETVVKNRQYANAGMGNHEHFPGAHEEPFSYCNAETCCVFNFIKLTEVLYSWNNDVKYIDWIESALYNSILPSQDQDNPEGYGKIYFNPFIAGGYRIYSTRDDAFWCCVLGGMESPARLSKMIYYKDGDNLFVNLFIPSRVTWTEKGLALAQTTNFPYESSTTLTVTSGAKNAGIKIRVPSWATGPISVTINGIPVTGQAVDGYIKIARNWAAGDKINITFPMGLSLYTARGDGTTVAFKYGPILLASSLGPAPREKRYSTDQGVLQRENPAPLPIPDLVSDSRDPNDLMEVFDRSTLTFRTKTARGGDNRYFVPYYSLNKDRFAVYWRLKGD